MAEEQQNKKRKITLELDTDLGPPPQHNLLIKTHSDKARIPTRGSALSAGYDLYRLGVGSSVLSELCDSHTLQRGKEDYPISWASRYRYPNFYCGSSRNIWTRRSAKWSW